jgi:hypothetical protein
MVEPYVRSSKRLVAATPTTRRASSQRVIGECSRSPVFQRFPRTLGDRRVLLGAPSESTRRRETLQFPACARMRSQKNVRSRLDF